MEKTYIVIAAYNEENNITKVICSLKKEGYHNIIVVDDGSKDQTSKVAKSAGAITLKHIINRGQGAALQTGMSYALLNNADYIVHFDADGQHNPKEIKYMLDPIIKKEVDATLGSRFLKKQKIPFFRKLMLKGGILAILIFYRIKLSDAHNGFRALSNSAAKKIVIKSDRMEHASEIVEQINSKKIKYKEIPVTIKYTKETLKNGRKGQGSFDSIKILSKMVLKKVGV
ncbi:glycosyltransferase family 2 protein [Candidatus Woesearchaeota archaeon]|nr:glycosyltransferase family 2 protein [Candidatus Woesearchaeota archaeon]